MKILVTGGAGYIGSHTCVELLKAGFTPVLFDNLSNANLGVLPRLEKITGHKPIFVQGDVRDREAVLSCLRTFDCEAVIHFAGLKAVGESFEKPLAYYDTNVVGTLRVLEAMHEAQVQHIIFSSSATVYGAPHFLPFTEQHPRAPYSPYGRNKMMAEDLINDFCHTTPQTDAALLRYFNPVGAHESGLIGEDPRGIPNNLMPFIAQVAMGRQPFLNVWGNDYETPDGTGVRDYIHVVDLAKGHVCALQKLIEAHKSLTLNLGTGQGTSVLDLVHAFEKASGHVVPYQVGPRRQGDIAAYYANATAARIQIGWTAEKGIAQMCADSWRWQSQNPNGYETTQA